MGELSNRQVIKRCYHRIDAVLRPYHLLEPGDKVIVGVSGGPDSLCLTHLLHEYNQRQQRNWRILAVHVDLGFPGWNSPRLARTLERIGVEYRIIKADVPAKLNEFHRQPHPQITQISGSGEKRVSFTDSTDTGKSTNSAKSADTPIPGASCFVCAFERRKQLFDLARRLGIKTIAYAHHMEDVNETYLMNLLFGASASAFLPRQDFFDGKLQVIRPLYQFDKPLILRYNKIHGLRPIRNRCPQERTGKRILIRRFLTRLYRENPRTRTNLFAGIHNVKTDYLPGVERNPRR